MTLFVFPWCCPTLLTLYFCLSRPLLFHLLCHFWCSISVFLTLYTSFDAACGSFTLYVFLWPCFSFGRIMSPFDSPCLSLTFYISLKDLFLCEKRKSSYFTENSLSSLLYWSVFICLLKAHQFTWFYVCSNVKVWNS